MAERRRRLPRTSGEVTADRLRDLLERYGERMTGGERDEISRVIYLVEDIAARPAR
jgi:hypothetical protein